MTPYAIPLSLRFAPTRALARSGALPDVSHQLRQTAPSTQRGPQRASWAWGLKRRLGIVEENVLIKKERLDDAQKEYEEEHRTFTVFSKRLDNRRRPILLDRKTRYGIGIHRRCLVA